MQHTPEFPSDQPFTVQRLLVELHAPAQLKTHEVVPADFPSSFLFTPSVLAEGEQLTGDGVRIFEQTQQPSESYFTVALDWDATNFVIVGRPSRHDRSVITYRGEVGSVSPAPLSIRHGLFPVLGRLATAIKSRNIEQINLAYSSAIDAHTHSPTRTITVPTATENGAPGLITRRFCATASAADVLCAAGMSRSSQMIFSPGMALLIIPTDKTPRLSRKEIRRREQQMDDWVRESYGLENQYVTALGTGYVAPALLAVLRRIYHDEVSDALTLFRRNVEESGDPQSAILNPVVALRMERVTALVESLSAVGYYYTSGNGGEFIRFTQV